jgi:hypothetical protein
MLLMDALCKCYDLSLMIGATGVIVDAENDTARAWYIKRGFAPFEDNPTRLFLPMNTIEIMLGATNGLGSKADENRAKSNTKPIQLK